MARVVTRVIGASFNHHSIFLWYAADSRDFVLSRIPFISAGWRWWLPGSSGGSATGG